MKQIGDWNYGKGYVNNIWVGSAANPDNPKMTDLFRIKKPKNLFYDFIPEKIGKVFINIRLNGETINTCSVKITPRQIRKKHMVLSVKIPDEYRNPGKNNIIFQYCHSKPNCVGEETMEYTEQTPDAFIFELM